MLSNYKVGITCDDVTILQSLVGLLQEFWCKIQEENGEYYWSSSLFETQHECSEVAKKADQYLPALNGLVRLHFANAHRIVRSGRIFFTNEAGGTSAYFTGNISIPLYYQSSISEEELEQRRQKWVALVKVWTEQNISTSNALNNAFTHFGEEITWNNLYNVYETIRNDCHTSQKLIDKGKYKLLPEQWTTFNGRNREKDFTESANNAYISGIISTRHSLASSNRVEEIEGSPFVEVIKSNGRKETILPMTLGQAKDFITSVLSQWLLSKQDSESK